MVEAGNGRAVRNVDDCRAESAPDRAYAALGSVRSSASKAARVARLAPMRRMRRPLRLISVDAESFFAVFLVLGVIPVKPVHFAVAFESKNVCGNPIQKPAIMRDDNGTAGKVV